MEELKLDVKKAFERRPYLKEIPKDIVAKLFTDFMVTMLSKEKEFLVDLTSVMASND